MTAMQKKPTRANPAIDLAEKSIQAGVIVENIVNARRPKAKPAAAEASRVFLEKSFARVKELSPKTLTAYTVKSKTAGRELVQILLTEDMAYIGLQARGGPGLAKGKQMPKTVLKQIRSFLEELQATPAKKPATRAPRKARPELELTPERIREVKRRYPPPEGLVAESDTFFGHRL